LKYVLAVEFIDNTLEFVVTVMSKKGYDTYKDQFKDQKHHPENQQFYG